MATFEAVIALTGGLSHMADCTFESNMAAALAAKILAEGKTPRQLASVCQFLQTLSTLLRNYM